MFLLTTNLFAVDVSVQHRIAETKAFIYFSEDTHDYAELVGLVEKKNSEFQKIFGVTLTKKIKIYIYKTQLTFSKCVFNSDVPVLDTTGFADHVNMCFYITSFYDTCKTKERLLQTPVHELVHIYFPHDLIWIREGIACYYAAMLEKIPHRALPAGFADLRFYAFGTEENRTAYNASGWILKFIIEELCKNDLNKFRRFSADAENYGLLGIKSEQELFSKWTKYMLDNENLIFSLSEKGGMTYR